MEQISHVARYLIFTAGVYLMSTFQWNCNLIILIIFILGSEGGALAP